MKHAFLSMSLAVGALLAAMHDANAQGSNCAPRDMVIDRLAERYGEAQQVVGLASDNTVVEVFASLETGTWTIIVTTAQGLTCLVAAGQSYEAVAETLAPGGKGA